MFTPITLICNYSGVSCPTKNRQLGLYKRGGKVDKDGAHLHWYKEEEPFAIPCICDAAARKTGCGKTLRKILDAFLQSVIQLSFAQFLLWTWGEPPPAQTLNANVRVNAVPYVHPKILQSGDSLTKASGSYNFVP